MIQRIQSIFFLLSALASLLIVFTAPVLSNEDGVFYLSNDFPYLRLLLFGSAVISIYAIFQYKNSYQY